VLAAVHGVVPLRQLARYPQQPQAHHPQALALQARDDVTDERALDTVGLDEDEALFHAGALRGTAGLDR
jgi:hypothetical protein